MKYYDTFFSIGYLCWPTTPPPQASVFSLPWRHCVLQAPRLWWAFSSPFNVGRVPRKFGHRRSQFFFQKCGGAWVLKERHSKPMRGKPEQQKPKHGKHENNHLERKLVIFFDDESSAILRLNSFVFFGSNLSLARGGHGTNPLVARISLHWASPSQWLKVEMDLLFWDVVQPMEIWMNLILY